MASACSSSMSIQKSYGTGYSTNVSGTRKKTSETQCSSKSSCILQKKKPVNPLSVSIRPPIRIDSVRQRVRSAKMVKIRALQSQLNDANFHLMELAQENRALKNTQRLQDKALNNYEGLNANLPQLLRSHEEENRALLEKIKTLKRQLREVTDTLKVRDDELLHTKDQLKHLTALAKDKHLEEREQLRFSLNEAKELIKNYETEISLLNRKLMLEVKNCRHKVNAEANKFKRCQLELSQLIGEVDRQNETKGRLLRKRFENSPRSQIRSTSNLTPSLSKETLDDVKLEPIKKRGSAENNRNSLVSPVEKIKARLSTTESRPPKIEDFNEILDKLSIEEEFIKKSLQSGIKSSRIKSTKLETIVKANGIRQSMDLPIPSKLKSSVSKIPEKEIVYRHKVDNERSVDSDENDELANGLEESEPEIRSRRHSYNKSPSVESDINKTDKEESFSDTEQRLKNHIKSLEDSNKEFNKVHEELLEIEKIELQLGHKVGTESEPGKGLMLKEEDYHLVNQIWNEEYSFRKSQREKNGDTNSLVKTENNTTLSAQRKDPIVPIENKKKLLETLREIDNGNTIDQEKVDKSIDNNNINTDSRKSRLMRELFG